MRPSPPDPSRIAAASRTLPHLGLSAAHCFIASLLVAPRTHADASGRWLALLGPPISLWA